MCLLQDYDHGMELRMPCFIKLVIAKGFVLHLSTAAVLEYEEVLVRELVPSLFASRDILWFLGDLIAASVRHASR
jgi:hypothetical protein